MIKIVRSEKTPNFILDNNYYQVGKFKVLNNGDYIDIQHIELNFNLYTKQHFSGFVKEDESGFLTIDECVDYLREIIGEPILLNSIDEQINIEKDLYRKRVFDGKEMSAALMAELRINSKINNLPREVNRFIEEKLDRVKTSIDRGWWVTALEELELTVPISFYTQELYDRIHDIISTYILENYN